MADIENMLEEQRHEEWKKRMIVRNAKEASQQPVIDENLPLGSDVQPGDFDGYHSLYTRPDRDEIINWVDDFASRIQFDKNKAGVKGLSSMAKMIQRQFPDLNPGEYRALMDRIWDQFPNYTVRITPEMQRHLKQQGTPYQFDGNTVRDFDTKNLSVHKPYPKKDYRGM